MGTLNDEILRATGGPTVQDGLMAWYAANGGSGTTVEDLERSLLLTKGAFTGTNQDLWMQWLDFLGFEGTLNDRLLQFWTAEATP